MTARDSRRKSARAIVVLVILLGLLLTAWIPYAAARTASQAGGVVTCSSYETVQTCVTPDSGPPGSPVDLVGNGWPYNATVRAYFLDAHAILTSSGIVNTGTGHWTLKVTVPAGAALGNGYWEVGPVNGSSAAVPFTVTNVPPTATATAVPPTSTVGTTKMATGTALPTVTGSKVIPGPPTTGPTATATPIPTAGYCKTASYYQTCIQPGQGPAGGPCAVGVYITGRSYNGGIGYPPYQQFDIYFTDSAGVRSVLDFVNTELGHSIAAYVYMPTNSATGVGTLTVTDSFGNVYAVLPFDVTAPHC